MMGLPITALTSRAAPLLLANIDTDQIIPSREMRSTGKTGLAKGLFAGWRYLAGSEYKPDPAFVLNDPQFANAQILLANENFGCGSSREHAVWALAEFGIRAIIAPSFAPIFENNCARGGVLCVRLPSPVISQIADSDANVSIDLPDQSVSLPNGMRWTFAIDEEAKAMLIGGLDGIELTMQSAADINLWHNTDQNERPWIYL
ncbi:MAG: 3-isopropylmalate dehydratase small subunit [Erythrobacter sp.]